MAFQILVPQDGSIHAAAALDWADLVGARFEADITLVGVIDRAESEAEPFDGSTQMLAHARLAQAAHRIRSTQVIQTVVASGSVGATIATLAGERHADLVIMTSRARTGLARALAGSTTATVIGESGVPVLVVRSALAIGLTRRPLRIVVPLDGSALSAQVLIPLVPLASTLGASLLLLTVLPPPGDGGDGSAPSAHLPHPWETDRNGAEAYLLRIAATLPACGIPVESAVRWGEPASEIVRLARHAGASMIAMCTHAREGLERVRIGSVTEEVVCEAPVPVLAIHPFGAARSASELDERYGRAVSLDGA